MPVYGMEEKTFELSDKLSEINPILIQASAATVDQISDWAKVEVEKAIELNLVPKKMQNTYTGKTLKSM